MTFVDAHLETPVGRFARWSGSAGMMLTLHITAVSLAILTWPDTSPKDEEQPGAIMMELPSLAAESPSEQQDLAEQPLFEQSAPPPSPAEHLEETPPETAQAVEPAPEPEKAVEANAMPLAEPVPEELPAVEEAPLAPEPEVTLPKEVAEQPEEKVEPKEKPEKKASEKAPVAKAAEKSESSKQQQAAASARGRFDSNPIYRAKPAYPPGARSAKVEGYVVVSYSVAPSGAVTSVRVVSASPPGIFNSATLAAVRQWRFKPSPQGGSRSTTVRFKLR